VDFASSAGYEECVRLLSVIIWKQNDNALLELIYELLERLPDLILEGMESVNMKVDKREFARMVKEVTAT
jgi:hypothetical protein